MSHEMFMMFYIQFVNLSAPYLSNSQTESERQETKMIDISAQSPLGEQQNINHEQEISTRRGEGKVGIT